MCYNTGTNHVEIYIDWTLSQIFICFYCYSGIPVFPIRKGRRGHILIISFLYSIDYPFQFVVLFDFFCDNAVPDCYAGTGYSKVSAQ